MVREEWAMVCGWGDSFLQDNGWQDNTSLSCGEGVRMREGNIVLVGFMGTGKSAVGRILAERLGRPLVDMDTLIEERQGKPIPRIFDEDGEPHFRALERVLVQELSGRTGLVISAGGGIVLDEGNIADFSRTGLVACLSACAEQILARVKNDANRPLLAVADKLGKIRELLSARKSFYDAVPFQVDTNGKSPAEVADAVLGEYRGWEGDLNSQCPTLTSQFPR